MENNRSKLGRRSRNKGSSYERAVAKKIGEHLDVQLVRTPQSGGFAKSKATSDFKGDITCLEEDVDFKLHVECKNQKTYSINKWVEQAMCECPENKIPVLIFKKNNTNATGKTGNQQDMILLTLEDFLSLADPQKILNRKRVVTLIKKRRSK